MSIKQLQRTSDKSLADYTPFELSDAREDLRISAGPWR